jgi:hypothetical protein
MTGHNVEKGLRLVPPKMAQTRRKLISNRERQRPKPSRCSPEQKFLPSNMSDSHIIFGHTPIREWIDRYEQSHKHPVNRLFHTLGIPMIAISIPLFLVAPLFRGLWRIPLSLFTLGWMFQFAGHALEGKPPEFFRDWRFLLVGLRWWWKKVTDRGRDRHQPASGKIRRHR